MDYKRWVEFESISERSQGCYCYHTCLENCHKYAKNENGESIRRCLCYENNKKRLFPNLSGALERRWTLLKNYELSVSNTQNISRMYQDSLVTMNETKQLLDDYREEEYIEPKKLEQIKKRKLEEQRYLIKDTNVIAGRINPVESKRKY